MKMNASDPDTFVEILLKDGEVPKEILNEKTRKNNLEQWHYWMQTEY